MGVAATEYDGWLRVRNVNLFSVAALSWLLLPKLNAKNGAVENVTSIAGSRVHPFAGVAYACSKAGLAALTRERAAEFGRNGLRVNAIASGEIDTSILAPGAERFVAAQIFMHRLGHPAEIARVIHFLCSDGASYVNGAELDVNGGQHV